MMNINVEIGARIKSSRIARGYSVSDVSKAIGVSERAYRFYESGKRDTSSQVMIKICETLGVSIDYIMRGITTTPSDHDVKQIINSKYIKQWRHKIDDTYTIEISIIKRK